MANQTLSLTIGNAIMKVLLRSPLHSVASNSIMLITVIGRKTAKTYTTPVNYIEDEEAGILTILSHQHRTWWRNLRGSAPVRVVLRGEQLGATGYIFESGPELVERFYAYLCEEPRLAPHLGVDTDEDGTPIYASAEAAAEGKVMIEVWLYGDYEEIDDEDEESEDSERTV